MVKKGDERPVVQPTGDPSAPLRLVRQVRFGLLSPEEILQLSATPGGIIHSQLYESDGSPKFGGLLDPRQGVIDKSTQCLTCHGQMNNCPGHFGHIDLAEPVYLACFMTKIVKILRCVCFYCYKLLVPPTHPHMKEILEKYGYRDRRRFQHIYELLHGKTVCDRMKDQVLTNDEGYSYVKRAPKVCSHRQPKYKQQGLEIIQEWVQRDDTDTEKKLTLWPKIALEVFRNISDEECRVMGIDPEVSRPDWMIATVLCVPPITTRPIAITFGASKNQDDLTYKLSDIVNANAELKQSKEKGEPALAMYHYLKLLQYHVATLVDNEIPGVPKCMHKSGKPLKSVKARLKGKEGRIRGNLMGKRVDFSARTVISPDPTLRLDEVGIPRCVAQNLTYPELVTPYNVDRIQALFTTQMSEKKDSPIKCIIKPNGERIHMKYNKSKIRLQPGYQIERDLKDGDLVVFNRQPTLHKMSMMGHRVKVLPHTTFRLNLSCTTPYNADFDGDEMNLHVPQSLEVLAEVEQLQLTTRQIITAQSNKPVMGIVQDALTGAMKMTRRDVFIDRARMQDLLMHATSWKAIMPQPAILKPKVLWTGKQLFSTIIPGKLNLKKTHSNHPDDENQSPYKWISPGDTKVLVENGELLTGILCQKTLGSSSGSLLHVSMLELGHEITGIFFNDIQNVINAWLSDVGHTVGYSDAIVSDEATAKVKQVIAKAKNDVKNLISNTRNIKAMPGKTIMDTFEEQVNSILNGAREESGSCVKNTMSDKNSFKIMVCAGSKGSDINIAQITACVGQQNVEGKRIPFGYGLRTLPHFTQRDNGPESRGFVENSFFSSLSPAEYYFHAMAGREGLIDTAVKTAETGYIQRRLMKAMESIMAYYDGTVRNSTTSLVQFCYGEDGLAGEKVEFQKIPGLNLDNQTFKEKFKLDLNQDRLRNVFSQEIIDTMHVSEEFAQAVENEWKLLENDRKELRKILPIDTDSVVLPCNLERMIWNTQKAYNININTLSDLTPLKIVQGIENLLKKCVIFNRDDKETESTNRNVTFLFQCLVRSYLCSKRVCEKYRFTSVAFDKLLKDIEETFQQAKVVPGEMVGALAAQSIGEPATQMTLNTFHYAGVSSKNVTLGVPRLKEIINISKNPKSPSTTIFLKEEAANNENKAREVMCRILRTTLRDVLLQTSIYYDPCLSKSVVENDQQFLDYYLSLKQVDLSNLSPWVYRLVFHTKKIADKRLRLNDIARKITSYFDGSMLCMASDDNAKELVVRVYPLKNFGRVEKKYSDRHMTYSEDRDDRYLRCMEAFLLSELTLKGIPSICKVFMTKPTQGHKMRVVLNEETGERQRVSEWLLETEGTALLEILSQKYVDHKRTYSDDIWEMYGVLGIEAVRQTLQKELRKVLDFYGLYVNYRHISLLCDTMTSKGYLMPITRHGINRQETGPFMRCSFEETADVLMEAAVHSERDYIRGVSENVIVGQLPRMGTGCFDLVLDDEKCTKVVTQSIDSQNPQYSRLDSSIMNTNETTLNGAESEYNIDLSTQPASPPSYNPSSVTYNVHSPDYSPSPISYSSYAPVSPSYTPIYVPSTSSATPSSSPFNFYNDESDINYFTPSNTVPGADSSLNVIEPMDTESPADPRYGPSAPVFDAPGYRPNL